MDREQHDDYEHEDHQAVAVEELYWLLIMTVKEREWGADESVAVLEDLRDRLGSVGRDVEAWWRAEIAT